MGNNSGECVGSGVDVGVGMHGAGMLARWTVGCAWCWNAGWGGKASFVVLPGERPPNCATSLWNIGIWTMLVVE